MIYALTILMIDDDEDDRFFFSMALHDVDPNIQLLTAPDGLMGLDYLKTTELLPDFIFLDINMPGMNGKDCLIEIRNDSRLAKIPVIMFSTSEPETEEAPLLKAGADFYLQKPRDFKIMPSLIRFIISGEYHKMRKFTDD